MLTVHQLNTEQARIALAVKQQENIICNNLAGSGKTALLAYNIHAMSPTKHPHVFATAHGKAITATLKDRLPKACNVRGLHGSGKDMLWDHFRPRGGREYIDNKKYYWICQDIFKNYSLPEKGRQIWTAATLQLWGAIRMRLLNHCDTIHLQKCADLHDIDLPYSAQVASEILDALYHRGIAEASWRIDFNDMLWLPEILDIKPVTRYSVACLDEFQDCNKAMRLLFKRIAGNAQVIIVGDQRQNIFQFAGAERNSLKNFQQQHRAYVYNQPVCFRCPTSHIDIAKTWVPSLTAWAGAQVGEVNYASKHDLYKDIPHQKDDVILCRRNRPLIEMVLRLTEQGVPAYVKGHSIGEELINMVERVTKGDKFAGFLSQLAVYVAKRTAKLNENEGNDEQIINLNDNAESLRVLYFAAANKGISTLWKWNEYIAAQFSDEAAGDVCLSTVHKFKGQEANNVFLLDPHLMLAARKPGQQREEENIAYVAHTRSKHSLTFLE